MASYQHRNADDESTVARDGPPSAGGLSAPGARDLSGEEELHAAGYEQALKRSLTVPDVVALTVSDITPMASLLVIAPAVFAVAGTGGLLAYLIG